MGTAISSLEADIHACSPIKRAVIKVTRRRPHANLASTRSKDDNLRLKIPRMSERILSPRSRSLDR